MVLEKVGSLAAVPDGTAALNIRTPTSESNAAVREVIAPVAGQIINELDPAIFSTPAQEAVTEEIATRDLVAGSDQRLPQFNEDVDWKWAAKGTNDMIPLGVDSQDRTFAAEWHPSMFMPDRMESDTVGWGLRSRGDGSVPFGFGPRGMFATQIHPNTPIPRRRVDLRQFLLPGELLPNDGARDAQPLFQRAWDAVAAQVAFTGPVQIYVPEGRYRLLRSIDVYGKGGVGIAGAGRNDTILLPTLAASAFYARIASGYEGPDHDDMTFTDFTVDGAGQGGTASMTNVKAFYIQRMRRARFENVTVKNIAATGFGIDFLQDAWFINCYAENCGRLIQGDSSTGAGFGFATGLYEVESIRMINCTSRNNRSHGAFLERSASRLANLPGAPGGHRSMGFVMIGCWLEGNYDGYFGSGGTSAIIQGNVFYKNRYAGIVIDENTVTTIADDLTQIRGNVIWGNGHDVTTGINRGGIRIRGTQVGIPPVIDGNLIGWNDGWGIKITDALTGDGLRITNNQIFESMWSGISITSGSGPHRLRIESNDLWNNGRGQTGVLGEEDGIVINNRTVSRAAVRFNRAWDRRSSGKTQKRGLALTGGNLWTLPRVQGNDLDGNDAAGFVDELHADTVRTYVNDNIAA